MMTDKDMEVLAAATHYFQSYGSPPTARVLAKAVGLKSPSTALMHVQRLCNNGMLPYPHRGYRGATLEATMRAQRATIAELEQLVKQQERTIEALQMKLMEARK